MRLRDMEGVKGEGSLDAFKADWHIIVPDPDNDLRDLTTPENRAHIERLKESLSVGWRQGEVMLVRVDESSGTPLTYAVDGRCRLTALAELEAEGRPFPSRVTVIQEQRGTERKKRMLTMLSSGRDKKTLSDAEFARGLLRSIEFGYTEQEVCAEMGWKSVASLHNHLDFLTLKPELRDMVDKGKISRTEALRLQRKTPDADPGEIMRQAEEEHARLNKKGEAKIRTRHVKAVTAPKADPKPPATPKSPEPALDAAELDASAPLPSGEFGEPIKGVKTYAQLQDEIAALTAKNSETPPAVVEGDAITEQRRRDAAEFDAATATPMRGPRPHSPAESILCSFLAASNAAELAFIWARLDREHDEASADGHDTDTQVRLITIADETGYIRFPDDWENAKATTELAQVA